MLFFAFIVLFLLFVSAAKALGVDYTSEALSDEIVWFDASEAPAALYGVHHNIFRCHERYFLHKLTLDDLRINHQGTGDIQHDL